MLFQKVFAFIKWLLPETPALPKGVWLLVDGAGLIWVLTRFVFRFCVRGLLNNLGFTDLCFTDRDVLLRLPLL